MGRKREEIKDVHVKVKNEEELFNVLRLMCAPSKEKDLIIKLWDGRKILVKGKFSGDHYPVCSTRKETISERKLRPFFKNLINNKTSFVLEEKERIQLITFI